MPKPADEPAKGRSAVEDALIEATYELLSEVGPRATSVRDVAARAGVNHAQVHHYFGGKRGLLLETMRRVARSHFETASELGGDRQFPPAITMVDEGYLRAVVLATIEGDLELAGVEFTEDISVWRHVLDHLAQRAGRSKPGIDQKVALAAGAAMQLGWLALEPLILLLADIGPDEVDEARARLRQTAHRVQAQGGQPSATSTVEAAASDEELDLHVGAKAAGVDLESAVLELDDDSLDERLGLRR